MSDSLILVRSRSGNIYVADPDDLEQSNDFHPIILIAAAILNAGYSGVALDEFKLANGKFIHSLDVDLSTHEGQMVQGLSATMESGGPMPDPQEILGLISALYELSNTTGSRQ